VEEVEEVDDYPVPVPPMEHVNDMHDESEQSNEDEVSTMTTLPKEINSHDECRTGLMIISVGPNFKKNLSKKILLLISLR
jgi:hypothetical protein